MTFWIQRMNCNFLHWKRFTWKLTIFVLNNYILSDSKPTAFSWSLNQPHPTNSSITACLTVLFVRSIIETYGINASAFVTKTAKEMAHSIMQWKHNFYINSTPNTEHRISTTSRLFLLHVRHLLYFFWKKPHQMPSHPRLQTSNWSAKLAKSIGDKIL